MRYVCTLCLFTLLPGVVVAEDKRSIEPIKEVKLERKEPVSYDKEIEPILINKCQFCHSGSVKEGKLDMSSYDSLMTGGKRGQPIVPGKAAESLLIRFAGRFQKPFMPPKGEEPLTPQELALVKLWIDQGAKAPSSKREKQKIILGTLPPLVHPVRALAISPNKALLAAGRANQLYAFDAGSGNYLRTLTDPELTTPDGKPVQAAHLSIVESLAYSANSKLLASGSGNWVTPDQPGPGQVVGHDLVGGERRKPLFVVRTAAHR